MKYIEISFERVVSLYGSGESSKAFISCTNGDLIRLDSTFIHKLQYFEQVEEVE